MLANQIPDDKAQGKDIAQPSGHFWGRFPSKYPWLGATKGFTSDEILANSIVFILAGHETTASTLQFFWYEMRLVFTFLVIGLTAPSSQHQFGNRLWAKIQISKKQFSMKLKKWTILVRVHPNIRCSLFNCPGCSGCTQPCWVNRSSSSSNCSTWLCWTLILAMKRSEISKWVHNPFIINVEYHKEIFSIWMLVWKK